MERIEYRSCDKVSGKRFESINEKVDNFCAVKYENKDWDADTTYDKLSNLDNFVRNSCAPCIELVADHKKRVSKWFAGAAGAIALTSSATYLTDNMWIEAPATIVGAGAALFLAGQSYIKKGEADIMLGKHFTSRAAKVVTRVYAQESYKDLEHRV